MNFLFIDKDKSLAGTLFPLLAKKFNSECRIVETCQDGIKALKEGYVPDFAFIEYDASPGNGMDVILYMQTKDYFEKVKVVLTTNLQDYKKIESVADMLKVHFERKPLQLFTLQRYITEHMPRQ